MWKVIHTIILKYNLKVIRISVIPWYLVATFVPHPHAGHSGSNYWSCYFTICLHAPSFGGPAVLAFAAGSAQCHF